MKAIALIFFIIIFLFFLLFLHREYSNRNFQKNVSPGDHCQFPYGAEWEIGIVTQVRDSYVMIETPDRKIVMCTKNSLLPV